MFARIVAGFAVGLFALLFITSQIPAQPGRGKDFGGFKKLEAEVEQLREQIKELDAKLAKLSEPGKNKSFEGFGQGKKGFDKKGDFFKKKGGFNMESAKLDPDTIKQRYEFYKKLYDELPKEPGSKKKDFPPFGRGFSGRGGYEGKKEGAAFGPGGVEARLDRLMRELEDLRRELKKK
jgi:hypothetical protein